MTTNAERGAAMTHAVRLAFQRAAVAPTNWKHQVKSGRVDARRVTRLRTNGSMDIFRQRVLPGATKVNVHVLVDGSSSMSTGGDSFNPNRITQARDVAEVLADAFVSHPSVRLNMWLHNSGGPTDLQVLNVMRDSKGRENIAAMPAACQGGNGDGYVLRWMGDLIRKQHRNDEVDLVFIISDGSPSWMPADLRTQVRVDMNAMYPEGSGKRDSLDVRGINVRDTVINMRLQGTHVVSVAIAPNDAQVPMYGKDYVVPFSGDWNRLAVDFGKTLGTVLATASAVAAKGARR